jgi:hypothetical protein
MPTVATNSKKRSAAAPTSHDAPAAASKPTKKSKGQKKKKAPASRRRYTNAQSADARASTAHVERSFVGDGSVSTYLSQLVRFTLFIFDKHEEYLTSVFLEKMKEADNKDKRENNGLRTALRNSIVHAIEELKPQRGEQDHNSFLKIEGEGELNYDTVVEYMGTKYNVVEVQQSCAKAYLKALKLTDEFTPDMLLKDGKVRLKVFQSYEQYSGIRSAICYVYKVARVEMSFAEDLSIYLKGVNRHIAAAKQHLGLKLTTGKAVMPPKVYEHIAETLFRSGEKRDIFCHLMLLLDWNLMKRSENCVHAKMIHIEFENDYLKFTFEKEKGKQHGDMHGPWHCFANPKKPHICLVLAFARYIFAFPECLQEGKELFPGTAVYGRYSSRMLQLFYELREDLASMGINYKELGTHSARKGVGSMVASGSTVGPPIVALCLRAGWKLGGVKEKYLFRQDAGDLGVGRRATCLDVQTKEFGISPPYFDYSDLDESGKLAAMNKLDCWLKERIPKVDLIPPNSWNLAVQCFASICYHYGYLNTTLDMECPLRFSSVFRGVPLEFQDRATVAYPWNATSSTPTFNGIPPHILHIAKLEELEQKIVTMEKNLLDKMGNMMDERGFSSTDYKAGSIEEAFKTVLKEYTTEVNGELKGIKKSLQDIRRIDISGVDEEGPAFNTCTVTDEDEDITAACADNEAESNELIRGTLRSKLVRKRKLHEISEGIRKKRKLNVGFHHGRLNVLPQDFKFASMTVNQFINCWLLGDNERNIPALCLLTSKEVMHFKSKSGVEIGNRTRLKMQPFMRIIEQYAKRKGVWIEKIQDWDASKVTKMWDAISDDFNAAFCKTNRSQELGWSTVYGRMSAANAWNNPRNKKEKAKGVDNNIVL